MVRPCLSLTLSLLPSLYNVTRWPNASKLVYAHPKAKIKKNTVYLLLTTIYLLLSQEEPSLESPVEHLQIEEKNYNKAQNLNPQLCGNITLYEENVVFLMGRNELSSAVVVVVVIICIS